MTALIRRRVQPVYLLYLGVGLCLALISLYPTFFLFYGSVRSAPLGATGKVLKSRLREQFRDYRLASG